MRPAPGVITWLLTVLILASGGVARGGSGSWSVRVWQSDGLPDRYINGLVQTEDGFIWLATSEHLVRFDGARFEPFSTRGLSTRGLRALLRAGDGVWLVTNRGPAAWLRRGTPPSLVTAL